MPKLLDLRIVLDDLNINPEAVNLVDLQTLVVEEYPRAYTYHRKGLVQVVNVKDAPTKDELNSFVRRAVARCCPQGQVTPQAQTLYDLVNFSPRVEGAMSKVEALRLVRQTVEAIRIESGTATVFDGDKALALLQQQYTQI